MSDKLQKLLAHAGMGSRREIETWITDGRVTVNGKRAKLGDRGSASDRILVDGNIMSLSDVGGEQIKALIYHKPEGEICTRKDPKGRPTIFDNLPGIPGGRWVSVGRLDINTSGLILLTNNGELANKLMHPSTGLEREYLVRVRGAASQETINKLTREGVDIDGTPAKFERVLASDMADEGTNHWYKVVIKEGRYREVRRMWDAVGHTVSRLKRIRYGTIKLTREIKRGKHVKIAPMQLEKLVASVGIQDQFVSQLYSSGAPRSASKVRRPRVQSSDRSSSDRSSIRGDTGSDSRAKPRGEHKAGPRSAHKPTRKKAPQKGKSRPSEASSSSSSTRASTRPRKR
ncbi:MAG: pseudouridine synthase [Arenicella sp.]|nr:pseudouridine synthase [Arenicella sp.]